MSSNLILVLFSISGLKEIQSTILLSKPSFSEIIGLLKETFPLGLTTIFNFLYGKIDIVILSIMLNFVIVAQYSVAYGLYKLSGMIFSVFLIPAFNLFAQNQENKPQKARLFYSFFLIILVSSSLTAGVLLFTGKTGLSLIYGDKYAVAANIIPYFSLAVIGLGMNSLTGSFLNATGNYNVTMYTTMTGFIFNAAANIILISKMGLMGTVYTAIFTEAIVFLLQLIFIIKMNYDFIWKRILTY
jgi:O-antigen/teichoic acid export membrane protein